MIFTFLLMTFGSFVHATDLPNAACGDVLAPPATTRDNGEEARRSVEAAWIETADVSDHPLIRWAHVRIENWFFEDDLDVAGFVAKHRTAGVDLDATDGRGRTALMHASINRKNKLMWALLRNGARVDLRDGAGHTAGNYAKFASTSSAPPELLSIEYYLTIDGRYVGDVVKAAVESPDASALEALLNRGLFIDAFDLELGRSLLTHAIQAGDLARTRMLLERGANPRFRFRNQDVGMIYPFPTAVALGHFEIAQTLLDHGATVDDGDPYAIEYNAVVRTILSDGPDGTNSDGVSKRLEWLLSRNANPDANYADGRRAGKETVAQILERRYADRPERRAQISALFRKYGHLR